MSFVSDAITALRDPSSLTRRAAVSSGWRLGGQSASMSIRLASNLLMTRLLAPEDFGLMAIVFTLHTGLIMIADIGIKPSIIRSTYGSTPEFLRTAWTVQIIQFSIIACLLILSGIALFQMQRLQITASSNVYGDRELPLLIVASATIIMSDGLRSTNWILAERNMLVKALIQYEILSQLAAVFVMIICAFFGLGVWSIILGSLTISFLRAVVSHTGLPGPPMRINWNRKHATEIWRIGRWLIGASMFGFISNSGDRLIFAALFDPNTFGLYAIALIWISALLSLIGRVVETTALAALAEKKRKNPERLSSAFSRLRTLLDIICITLLIIVLLFSEPFMTFVYTERFHDVSQFLLLMSGQIILLRYKPFISLLLNDGATRQIAGITVVLSLTMLIVPPLTYFFIGTHWSVVAAALNAAWGVPLLLRAVGQRVRLELNREYIVLTLIVFGTLVFSATQINRDY